jgi:hypothetical protein
LVKPGSNELRLWARFSYRNSKADLRGRMSAGGVATLKITAFPNKEQTETYDTAGFASKVL